MSPNEWIAKGTDAAEVRVTAEWPELMINHKGLNSQLSFTKKYLRNLTQELYIFYVI